MSAERRRVEKQRRGGSDGDEVLPEGRDEAMSTPQKVAGSWRPPQAFLQKENMRGFQVCVKH